MKPIEFLKSFFGKKPKLTGRQINMWEHSGWGNSLYFIDFSKREISGHMWDGPKVGDIINSKMESGKIGQFIVVDMDYQRDPPDMFFGKVMDFGYKDN